MQAHAGLVALGIANPAIGAGDGLQHEAEVFGGHGGQHIVKGVVVTDHFTHHGGHELGFAGVVGGVGVGAGAQRELGRAQMGGCHVAADAFEAFDKHLARFLLQGAHGAGDDGVIGNDVFHGAAGDLAHGEHGRVQRIGAARDQGLQLADDGAGHGNRVQRGVGHGRMATLAVDPDLKAQGGGHDGANAHGHLAGRQRWPVVQRKHGFAGEFLEQAVIHHGLGASASFFGWLEDQVHRAVKVGLLSQGGGSAQQHGGVAVVAAGMHAALVLADVPEGVDFRDGQGIHVGADADAAAGVVLAAALAVDAGDDASLAQATMHGQAQGREVCGDLVAGAVLFVFELRIGVQVAAKTEQRTEVRSDIGCRSHTGAAEHPAL